VRFTVLGAVDAVDSEVDVDAAGVVELDIAAVGTAGLGVVDAGWAAVVPDEALTPAGDEDVL
jgi:hypothetical protein